MLLHSQSPDLLTPQSRLRQNNSSRSRPTPKFKTYTNLCAYQSNYIHDISQRQSITMAKGPGNPASPVYILFGFTFMAILAIIITAINAVFFIMPNNAIMLPTPFGQDQLGLNPAGYAHVRRSFFAAGLACIFTFIFALATVLMALKRGGQKA